MAEGDVSPAWLGLGANLGDRAATIAAATRRIGALPGTRVVARSGLYETAPWGEAEQPSFLNAVVAVETALDPHALLDAGLAIEAELGRVRGRRWGPRTIDIDVLAYAGLMLDEPRLTLPHPRLTERSFALAPLAELAPGLAVRGRAVAAWLAEIGTDGIERLEAPT